MDFLAIHDREGMKNITDFCDEYGSWGTNARGLCGYSLPTQFFIKIVPKLLPTELPPTQPGKFLTTHEH